jgi:hypothetical protein
LEDTLAVLKDGRPANVAYETTFLIGWPDHLGGGTLSIEFEGAMVLVPHLSI